jgi:phage terminase large subunit
MDITFKTKNPKQLQATEAWLDDSVDEILYGGAKGGGKSYLGCSLIFGDALIYPETHYFIARKELVDLRKFTLPSIQEVFKNWGLDMSYYAPYNDQSHSFNLYNGSKVFFIACPEMPSDPLYERFGSMQMTRGWIEEGGEVPENAKANLSLSIGRWKNDVYNLKRKLLITANPKKGWMKRDFVDPFKAGRLAPSLRYIQAFATDNKYLPEDYIQALSQEKNAVRRQRLFEGDWDYNEDKDSLITYDALTDTFSNTITKDGNKYLIVDVARLGRDSTVFSLWEGMELVGIQKYEKQATNITEQRIKDTASINQVPFSNILVDEDGIGGGVVDHLFGVRGFGANSSPLPTASEIRTRELKAKHDFIPKVNFKNLKAQCAWKLAESINEHKIAFKVPDHREEIMEELTSLLRDKEVDAEGKKQLRPKDDVKQEIGHSPDVGDTLIMRMWFELKKEALNENPEMSAIFTRQQHRFDRNRTRLPLNSSK